LSARHARRDEHQGLHRVLAPYQDPMISRIELSSTMTPGMPLMGPAEAGDKAKVVEGRVIGVDDPVALGRFYARAVNKVAR
jgi:hypothetical protein